MQAASPAILCPGASYYIQIIGGEMVVFMADFDSNRFASKKDYATPWDLFNVLNEEFHFTLDVCADEQNRKVDKYFSIKDDGLSQDWKGVAG